MDSTAATAAVDGGRISPTKHRACDECRTRKLACSKEQDGCARCKRELIKCNYSAQKPMGRPRKRPHSELIDQQENVEGQVPQATMQASVADMSFTDFDATAMGDFTLAGLLDIGWSETANPEPRHMKPQALGQHIGFGVLDFDDVRNVGAGTDAMDIAQPHHLPTSQIHHHMHVDAQASHHSHLYNQSHYNEPGPQAPAASAGDAPTGGSPSNSASSASEHGPKTPPAQLPCIARGQPSLFPNVVCPCLAQMYLALDALQNLPLEVGPAMACARNAAKTASQITSCQICSPSNFTSVDFQPTVQAFQNMMMLGALLPSISNAYSRILPMIDEEVARAARENRELTFALAEYGGLWGRLAEKNGECSAIDVTRPMSPPVWRATVRALLRVDVYGVNENSNEGSTTPGAPDIWKTFRHIGLINIVEQLEERSRMRHAYLDELVASGQLSNPGHIGHHVNPPDGKHNCQRILEVARKSIEHLVIA